MVHAPRLGNSLSYLNTEQRYHVTPGLCGRLRCCFCRPSQICREAFYKSGLSTNYNETIAHAVHSMSVEGLRLFDPMASEQNKIPTVNQDLSQDQKVLNYAPHFHTSTDFATSTMNMIDKILSTVGNSKDGLGPHWSSVERIAHVFHMWDLWQKVGFRR